MLEFKYNNPQRKIVMRTFIGIEYLAAVALIQIYETNEKRQPGAGTDTRISFEQLNNYGIKVMEKFEADKIDAIVLLSSSFAVQAVRDYSDCFTYEEKDGVKYLVLAAKVADLKRRLLVYLSLDILMALTDEEVLKVLEK